MKKRMKQKQLSKMKTTENTEKITGIKKQLIAIPSIILAYIVLKLMIFTNDSLLSSKTVTNFINNHNLELLIFYLAFYYFIYLAVMKTRLNINHKAIAALAVVFYSSTISLGIRILYRFLNTLSFVSVPVSIPIPEILVSIMYVCIIASAYGFFYYLLEFLTSRIVIGWIKKTFSRQDVQLGIVVSIFTTIITALINFTK